MLTHQEIATALRRANPVPDEKLADQQPSGLDALFSSIMERKGAMVRTTEKPVQLTPTRPPHWYHKPATVLTSFLVIIATIAAVTVFTGGGPANDFADRPAPGTFLTYGPAEGITTDCYGTIGFGAGTAWYVGDCGLLELEGETWVQRAELPNPELTVLDVEVAVDGTVWVGGIGGGVFSYDGQTVTTHELEATRLAVTSDGTVWATEYLRPGPVEDEAYELRSFDGQTWARHEEAGQAESVAIGPDDTLWFAGLYQYGSFDGTRWTTVEDPLAGIADVGADGTVWGLSESSITRYDGAWTITELPTLADLAIEPYFDGSELLNTWELTGFSVDSGDTAWMVSRIYGALSYDGTEWAHYSTDEGLVSNRLSSVEVAPDYTVWFVSESEGLSRYYP